MGPTVPDLFLKKHQVVNASVHFRFPRPRRMYEKRQLYINMCPNKRKALSVCWHAAMYN